MNLNHWRHGSWAVLCGVAVLLTGCGGGSSKPVGSVTGVVSLGGTPLTEGEVNLYSAESGSGAIAKIGPDGKFKIDGELPTGTYSVTVKPPGPTPDNPKPKPTKIPKKYQIDKTTDLTAKVEAKANDIKLDLVP